jgi:hypothetical protein
MKLEMDFSFKKIVELCETMKTICFGLKKFLLVCKSQSYQKVLIKTIIRMAILSKNNRYKELMEDYEKKYGYTSATIMSVYGCLQNQKLFNEIPFDIEVFHETFMQCSRKYSENSKYLGIATENYIQAYDIVHTDCYSCKSRNKFSKCPQIASGTVSAIY